MPVSKEQLSALYSLLSSDNILQPHDEDTFKANTVPWSLSYDLAPSLVLTPPTVSSLESVLKFLYQSDLDFAIRGSGCGSVSAKDVIVSTKHFNTLSFDKHNEEVIIGAGLNWGQVDEKLAELAPGYVVVGARCPYVGVAGSTMLGGLSWLSHSLGLGSDRANFLDAHIVLPTGGSLWASTSPDPDLLWALRGAGGSFGVVTALRLKAHRHTTTIWAGMILYPPAALEAVSTAVATFAARDDPALALHVFVVDFAHRALHGGAPEPNLALLPYDAHGRAHAESHAGFRWALDIPGAQPQCAEMPLAGVHALQAASGASHGQTESWLQAALVARIDERCVVRAWEWYKAVVNAPATQRFGLGTFALLEIMQERAMTGAGSDAATAWPRFSKGRRHVLQLSTGCAAAPWAQRAENERAALAILRDAVPRISGVDVHPPGDYLPNFMLPSLDAAAVFGANWEKVRRVKGRYDPLGKLYGGIAIPPLL